MASVSISKLRARIVLMSLGSSSVLFIFAVLAPILGYPIDYEKSIGIIKLLTPTFFGYVGAAANFAVADNPNTINKDGHGLIWTVTFGPVLVFWVIVIASFGAYGLVGLNLTPRDLQFPYETLTTVLTIALSLLSVSTSIIVVGLFGKA